MLCMSLNEFSAPDVCKRQDKTIEYKDRWYEIGNLDSHNDLSLRMLVNTA